MQATFYIPDQLQAIQKLLTIGMDLYLESNGNQFGIIKQKLFQLGSYFNLQDLNNNVICHAQSKFIALGTQFQIFDNMNNRIGTVVQEYIKSMFSFGNRYTVYDGYGNVVAKTKQQEIVKTHVEVMNNFNALQVKMEKTHIFKDKWSIEFYGGNVDRRLLIFFPAFISMKQEERRMGHDY